MPPIRIIIAIILVMITITIILCVLSLSPVPCYYTVCGVAVCIFGDSTRPLNREPLCEIIHFEISPMAFFWLMDAFWIRGKCHATACCDFRHHLFTLLFALPHPPCALSLGSHQGKGPSQTPTAWIGRTIENYPCLFPDFFFERETSWITDFQNTQFRPLADGRRTGGGHPQHQACA